MRDIKTIDMTPQGEFAAAPEGMPKLGWPLKLGIGAALVAVAAIGVILAAMFLWLASILVPVALVAAAIAYAAFRLQVWRARTRPTQRNRS